MATSLHQPDRRAWPLASRVAWAVTIWLAASLYAGCTPDGPSIAPPVAPRSSVVIVTFDGVRPPDLFEPRGAEQRGGGDAASGPAMPFFVNELGPTGVFLGRPGVGEPLRLANPIGVSLPGYQSIFAGRPTFCFSNECGALTGDTLFRHVREGFDLPPDAIAMFATWPGLCDGIGATGLVDATCGPDAISALWRERIGGGPPGADPPPVSIDRAAFELGLQRLRTRPPAILYIALDETDGTGHADDRAGHLATLARYDDWLRLLDAVIRSHEKAGRPITLIVTTDHGRGSGDEWSEHRWNVAGTQAVWLFARGPGIAAGGAVDSTRTHTLADVRPTIERLMGLDPVDGPCHGDVIDALLTGPRPDTPR